ncbi:MAG TPA: T9SS type A sorting domain-containing protein [Saprospiraceae bacterium]|nr:T9SS type A sorting domain-containing protein [Saprospiraceae bacterium]
MNRLLLITSIITLLSPSIAFSQTCQITAINATALPCNGNFFSVSINLEAENTSPGFTLAGNGVVYGTFLYADLPVTVGPLLGDNESVYEFIAWDVEHPECQQFTTLEASNCGPICDFSNAELSLISCVNNNFALVELDFDHEGTTNPAFDVFYENGNEVGSWLYESLPVTITSFAVNGADPITLTICDNENSDCCETFVFDAIDCNPNNCELYNVLLDPECTGNNFVVHLNFDFTNVASDSFTVVGNSLNYGTFGYNELPVTLGPLNGGTNIMWEFVIRDTENPDCQHVEILGLYNCPPPCDILSLSAESGICSGDTAYSILIEMDIEGEGDNGFSVFSDMAFLGSYDYDNLPLTLTAVEGDGDLPNNITVCDNEVNGCCESVLYEALLCSGCIIMDLEVIPQPCNAENEFFVSLDFYNHNVSTEGFSVSGAMMQLGEFQYEDLPVLVGPFNGDGNQYIEFVVTDLVNEDCFGSIEVGLLGCDDICSLSNLVVETGDCTGNNEYVLTVDFDFENTIGDHFDLFVNGEFFGFYAYADLPLTIEEFPGSGNPLDTITVSDNDNPDCFATLVFEAPDCECHIFEATIDDIHCTSDTTFGLNLEFFYENLPGNFVDVSFDGEFIGFYSVNELPLHINNIPEGTGTGVLTVCANDLNSCCASVVIELLSCDGPPCNIFDLVVNFEGCQSDSTYLVAVNFEYNNLPSDSVFITANDQEYGPFFVNNGHVLLELPVFPTNHTVVHVCAIGAPDCCDVYEFETPDCNTSDCDIWDLVAVPGDCLTDSTYILVIEYNSENIPGDSVNVFVNGELFGTFVDPDEHIVIEHFPWFDGDVAVLTLCSVAFPDCCDTDEFEIPNCPGSNDCHITELVINFEGCQSDSTYLVAINFEYDNLPSDSVNITANDHEYGPFFVNNGHIVLQLPVFSTNFTVIHVCADGAPDCCAVHEFETPDCNTSDCEISGLVADPGICLTDSTYILVIEYNSDNVPGDSFHLFVNGDLFGTFVDSDGHIVIEHFPWFDGDHAVITLCSVAFPDCCDSYEFEIPNCPGGGDCHIFDLVVNFEGCQSDSTFLVAVNFESDNLPSDSVIITANDQVIGQFPESNGHILVVLPVLPTNHTVVHVCAVGAPDCCDVIEFETPVCDGSCHLFDLFAEHGQCTSDSTFLVDIVFESNNLPGDSVTIYANDVLLGNYFNNPDFIRIENFPLLPGETTLITVCAVGDPECCDTYIIENPSCGGGQCDIYDVVVDIIECTSDSTFAALINFQYENITAGGFDVYTGSGYLGFFNFDQIPILTSNFPSNNSGEYVVTICESDNLDCCESLEFEGPVCVEGSCDIFNLQWSITECDEEGNFFFILDFDFVNVGNEGFNVVGNGNNYGNFSYENLPIQIGPFETNNTLYEFLVTDAQNSACFDVVVPGVVDCTVGTDEVDHDDIFQIYNNGTIPSILALKDVSLSLFNSNGKMIFHNKNLNSGNLFELNNVPNGMYVGTVIYQDNIWPVKLVKSAY